MARIYCEDDIINGFERDRIFEIFEELNTYLPCPPYTKSNWPSNAVAWFKDSSKKFIQLFFELKSVNSLMRHKSGDIVTILVDGAGSIEVEFFP